MNVSMHRGIASGGIDPFVETAHDVDEVDMQRPPRHRSRADESPYSQAAIS